MQRVSDSDTHASGVKQRTPPITPTDSRQQHYTPRSVSGSASAAGLSASAHRKASYRRQTLRGSTCRIAAYHSLSSQAVAHGKERNSSLASGHSAGDFAACSPQTRDAEDAAFAAAASGLSDAEVGNRKIGHASADPALDASSSSAANKVPQNLHCALDA